MNPSPFRRLRICPICRGRNTEVGQRGARLAHSECRTLVDAGYTTAVVRLIMQRRRLLAVLETETLKPESRVIREAGMGRRVGVAGLNELIAERVVERYIAVSSGSGRSSYLYRRRQEAAA